MMILIQYHSKNSYIIDFIFMGGCAKVWCAVIVLQIFIENTGKTLRKRFMYIILRFIYEKKYLLECTINILNDRCSLTQTLKTINVIDGHK